MTSTLIRHDNNNSNKISELSVGRASVSEVVVAKLDLETKRQMITDQLSLQDPWNPMKHVVSAVIICVKGKTSHTAAMAAVDKSILIASQDVLNTTPVIKKH